VVIAGFQWHTARQRVLLDLFERRMAIFDGIRKVVSEVVNGGAVRTQDVVAFSRAMDRVDLLFGPEVKAYLDELHQTFIRKHHAGATLSAVRSKEVDLPDAKAQEVVNREADAEAAAFEEITRFCAKFPKQIEPYVEMRQRRIWPPRLWTRARDKLLPRSAAFGSLC
jgi:hypothetical protein